MHKARSRMAAAKFLASSGVKEQEARAADQHSEWIARMIRQFYSGQESALPRPRLAHVSDDGVKRHPLVAHRRPQQRRIQESVNFVFPNHERTRDGQNKNDQSG